MSAGTYAVSPSRSAPAAIRPRITRWTSPAPTPRPRVAGWPELDALTEHVRSFAHMLTQPQGHQLPAWIEAATSTGLPGLQRFARHLERDLDAVTAGLSQPWNSEVVEGRVNRIKMLKRQMFGRAGFELLYRRVLLYS
ncbi:transposase [Streptomyces sp. NPDC017254]|uniref:transposase n=1 Tax=unclassified Streptomyces TaxID=2593676 RepID=UPI0037A40AC9